MNIFYLDKDPVVAAQMHCNKHVVKMILESAQMLSTAHRVLDGDEHADNVGMYKMVHRNHPSSIWVRTSDANYAWLYKLYGALLREYTYRYNKCHASEQLLYKLWVRPRNLLHGDFTSPPQCMPDYCKNDDTVFAYQNYYILEKSSFATWKRRDKPEWFYEREKEHA